MAYQVPPLGSGHVIGLFVDETRTSKSSPNLSSSMSSAADHHPLPPPPIDSPAPSLHKGTRVTLAVAAMNGACSAFWGTVGFIRSLPSRGVSTVVDYTVNKAITAATHAVARKAIGAVKPPPPDSHLQKLKYCLDVLHGKVRSNSPIDDNLRVTVSQWIDHFLQNHKTYLSELFDPNGLRAGLDSSQQAQFKTLSNTLQKNEPLDIDLIEPLCDLIHTFCEYEYRSHIKKLETQLIDKSKEIISLPPASKTGRLTQKSTTHKPPAKPVPANPIPLIVKKLEELKLLSFKLALGFLVLPESILRKPEKKDNNPPNESKTEEKDNNPSIDAQESEFRKTANSLVDLVKKSMEQKDVLKGPIEHYQEFLYKVIDDSSLNYFQKTWRKLTCTLLAPTIFFLVDHLFDQCQNKIFYLIGLTASQRLDLVVKMFIEPGKSFISCLNDQYHSTSKDKPAGTTIDEAISKAIDQIKIPYKNKDLTPKDLITHLVGSFFDQYAPSFNWSSTATTHFEKRAQQSKSPFYSLWFMTWSYMAWIVNLISAPGRWCFNKIIGKAVKTFVVWKIDSKINAKDGSSWDFGKLALRAVYKTLHDKLDKINHPDQRTDKEIRRKLALEPEAFVDQGVQHDIKQLVFSFIKLLDIQDKTFSELAATFCSANSLALFISLFKGFAISPGVDKATKEIIQGLQIFLEEKTFSVGILNVLQDICQQSLNFNTIHTNESFTSIENKFSGALKKAIERGLDEIIHDALDPSELIKEAGELFIDGIKLDIEKFKYQFFSIYDLTLSNLEKLNKLRTQSLVDVFARRHKEAEAVQTARAHLDNTKAAFNSHAEPIRLQIESLVEIAKKRKEIEDRVKDLTQLQAPLERAIFIEALPDKINLSATKFYTELQRTLIHVSLNTYPPSVQQLIDRLQKHFEEWNTEAKKLNNQSCLNITIKALQAEIKKEVGIHNHNIEAFNREIAKEFEQTKESVLTLHNWSKKLTYFTSVSAPPDTQQLQEVVISYLTQKAPPIIMERLQGFFRALGKNHNIKGVLWYCIKAYLELPEKSPQGIKKILDKVKARLQEPFSDPGTPQ